MIDVLIIDDSNVVQEFLTELLTSDPNIAVIGVASSGEEALQMIERIRPDVITMDIHMPNMNGFETARRIMETHPTPIVIVSGSLDTHSVATTFQALEAGALSVVARPPSIGHSEHESQTHELLRTVRLMSEVKVIRRWPRVHNSDKVNPSSNYRPGIRTETSVASKLVAIGASTGGPPILQSILSLLPPDFSVPIVIVQHMSAGFVAGFVQWLAQATGRTIQVAQNGDYLMPGHVYIAPDGNQMQVNLYGRIVLLQHPAENGVQPSISYLFRSVNQAFGPQGAGVLLTGMGKDGAAELKAMKEKGALTLVQDKESSIVYGMPGEAVRLGAATHVLDAKGIAAVLTQWADKQWAGKQWAGKQKKRGC